MGDITSANAVLMLSQPAIFPVPVQIQGFAADDVYDIDQIASVETAMGVDGILSAGFVYAPVMQNIALQADSASIAFFDQIWARMQSDQLAYAMNGLILLRSVSKRFTQTKGFLKGYTPMPAGKRTLQPQRFQIEWERVLPTPA